MSSRGGKGSRNKHLQAVSEQMHDETQYYPRLCKRIDEVSKASDGLVHAPSLRRCLRPHYLATSRGERRGEGELSIAVYNIQKEKGVKRMRLATAVQCWLNALYPLSPLGPWTPDSGSLVFITT